MKLRPAVRNDRLKVHNFTREDFEFVAVKRLAAARRLTDANFRQLTNGFGFGGAINWWLTDHMWRVVRMTVSTPPSTDQMNIHLGHPDAATVQFPKLDRLVRPEMRHHRHPSTAVSVRHNKFLSEESGYTRTHIAWMDDARFED